MQFAARSRKDLEHNLKQKKTMETKTIQGAHSGTADVLAKTAKLDDCSEQSKSIKTKETDTSSKRLESLFKSQNNTHNSELDLKRKQ